MLALAEALLDEVLAAALLALLAAELLDAALLLSAPVLALLLAPALDELPLPPQAVLTPHPGEAARLLGASVESVTEEPLRALAALRERYGCRVVLKGARTLAADGTDTAVCRYGSPALAKGGSGDMLGGILAAMLARPAAEPAQTGMDAVIAGVLLHARMGEEAERRFGADTVTPEEILGCLAFPER